MFIGIQASSFTNVLYIGFCRDADYDFSMGACLHALHSSCPGYVVESTAADIVNVLPTPKSSKGQQKCRTSGSRTNLTYPGSKHTSFY